MKSKDIRETFLEFFETNGHKRVKSSPLVPGNDPTLLFTNAGMVQFKDVFLGHDKLDFDRAVTSQRCVRAGGKHNDLENVGYTARHHTFFEMLGNFSFGDYFKAKAIKLSWELMTNEFGLDPKNLLVTVYENDQEAYDIWKKEIKLPSNKIIRIGDKLGGPRYQSDNFWQMGDTGPCGPCSEIFWDHGSSVKGGPPGSPDEDGDRFIEIWNLVFMQFNRDASGNLDKLPKPSVDTGMGLERVSAVLQEVHSNYEIDIFQNLIKAAGVAMRVADLEENSLKVIADHIRACSFLVTDGVMPSNEGRGYVLRRIIRRAIRHGYKLGVKDPFFYGLVRDVIDEMGDAYPELVASGETVSSVLYQEEIRFAQTLQNGMELLENAMFREDKVLDGETVFKLYDTYGFPVDLTADIAREKGIHLDFSGFEAAMDSQRRRARASSKFQQTGSLNYSGEPTEFHGYEQVATESTIVGIYKNFESVEFLESDEYGVVVLDRTPFYAESGGQVGDRGVLASKTTPLFSFVVEDTQLVQAGVFGHHGLLSEGRIKLGDAVNAKVNINLRYRAACNHSVTHLMHAALRKVLGENVQQKGSLVDEDRTRFDFSNNQPVSIPDLNKIESLVNEQVRLNISVTSNVMPFETAVKSGALALFGEKYTDTVRVIGISSFSRELCGGTHVSKTGEIGFFKIIDETGIASGVRRIEAVTGDRALLDMQNDRNQLRNVSATLKAGGEGVELKALQVLDKIKFLEKENNTLRSKLALSQGVDLLKNVELVQGIKVLVSKIENADINALRQTMDQVKVKLGSGIVVLASVKIDSVLLVAGVTEDLIQQYQAGQLVAFVAKQVGGKGGGRPTMAQGGGSKTGEVTKALASVKTWVSSQ